MLQPHEHRIMTYNIRLNTPADGRNAWPHRKDKVADMIRRYEPDSVGLQEALSEQVEDLAAELPDYTWFGLGREGGNLGEHNVIFYRKDRLQLQRAATFWLSETPDVACTGWDAHCPRIVTWGEFKALASGNVFYHFNTHLDHLGERARTESAKLLVATVASVAKEHPAVLTGDFNFLATSEAYKVLTQSLQDSLHATESSSRGPDGTFFGFRVTEEAGIRIDYIFVKGFGVLCHSTLSDSWEGFYPSDHLPVLVKVALPAS